MKKLLICMLLSYCLGSLNPAALIAKIKQKDLRQNGTGNLGATNTMLIFGKGYGALVMLLDITKSFLAVKLSVLLFPQAEWAPLFFGLFAVLGHIFPFYLRFRGGKGLAAFGGVILAFDPLLFLLLLGISFSLMLCLNYSYAMPFSASILFPFFLVLRHCAFLTVLLACLLGATILFTHWSNFQKARKGREIKIRGYLRSHFWPFGNKN
jgi:glycerol-3-phosphate acyltransferase PlsY